MIVDLTPLFKAQISTFTQLQASSPSKLAPSVRFFAAYTGDIYNSLIKIKNTLSQSRQNYFSNASYSYQAFSDRQRDELNDVIKSNLDQVSSQINEINEKLKNNDALQSTTRKKYQKEVILCLFQLFKSVSAIFKEFLCFSQKRKKKIQSTIAISKQFGKGSYKWSKAQKQQSLPKDEELERQADILYVQKVKEQQSIQQTQKQVENLNQMMRNMSTIVLQQELQTSSFLQIGETGLFHIQRGNKNLIQANILAKQTGKFYSLAFFLMGLSLLILDFIKS